jgi:toxin ParE1/3/4
MKARACWFSPQAEQDLEEIGDYIAEDNPSRALSFVQALRVRCNEIAHFPEAVPARPELGPGLRMAPFWRYLIFYTYNPEQIRIERIIHGTSDLLAIFRDLDE